jgi:surfeit locus 1 family protein
MILRLSIFGNRYYFTFKFLGLALFFIILFSSLGVWQCHRATLKKQLIQAYQARLTESPIKLSELLDIKRDNRFYSVQIRGQFDNSRTVLLDNKTLEGQVGYEVYTPFIIAGTKQALLIDRGWVPASANREQLPDIRPVNGTISIQGTLNYPPSYFSLGSMTDSVIKFPLRVQFIDLKLISSILGYSVIPYILWLDPNNPEGYTRHWKVALMGPEKHILYAVQWFAFALSLLVIFVVLNFHRQKNHSHNQ